MKNITRKKNNQKLMEIAIDYVNGSGSDKERIIESVNSLISEAGEMKRPAVKKFIEHYRDALLEYENVEPVRV